MSGSVEHNAVELTVHQAWFIADLLGAGTFPDVLMINPPFGDPAVASEFQRVQSEALTRLGVISRQGHVAVAVARWMRLVCHPERYLEMRYVRGGDMLRGIIARKGDNTVVALRNSDIVTFTELQIDYCEALAPVMVTGLSGKEPAKFPEFTVSTAAGGLADQRLRNGADVDDVMDELRIPSSARAAVKSAFGQRDSYVEIVAADRQSGTKTISEVGVNVFDTEAGRILTYPSLADDGRWLSTFTPGTALAISVAVEQLTATLPSGSWFPDERQIRHF